PSPRMSPQPARTALVTLTLPDALPISVQPGRVDLPAHPGGLQPAPDHDLGLAADQRRRVAAGLQQARVDALGRGGDPVRLVEVEDRKSTRLNSSHVKLAYAVFCLKKTT